ncbi:hypothetical protein CEE36_04805 [candidate division TA06 bacterium B3_TA06]|uniref:Uncharacterized protein n=1 Tax=candidate division TA06 bacterium B3_TA06 TaxID=2012487 RepID=A0A532V820_UNCT6|nr:MAG: hypothetical protein CEE36_04805 [candidate division TA06 bacterium B3_TA06]
MLVMEFEIVKQVVESKPRTAVKPREFFIAWSGVSTLAYQGFTRPLLGIKRELEQKIPGIKPENPGSKWPKTTLGALRDDRQLSWVDLNILRDICNNLNQQIDGSKIILPIHQLEVVIFQCRSLEKRLITYPIELNSKEYDEEVNGQHKENDVDKVMDQFHETRLAGYWSDVSRPGNRESHYRMLHIESTLIYDLPPPKNQPTYIDTFIEEVEKRLPGLYCWFAPESRHMTVRALS